MIITLSMEEAGRQFDAVASRVAARRDECIIERAGGQAVVLIARDRFEEMRDLARRMLQEIMDRPGGEGMSEDEACTLAVRTARAVRRRRARG